MEKVAASYYVIAPMSSSQSNVPSSINTGGLERSSSVRGHHSGVTKAVEAHRQMVEERTTRKVRRDRDFEMYEAPQPTDLVIAQQVTQESSAAGGSSQDYENTLIEPAESQARAATVQAFQTQEPDRPFLGEPVPKGSYIDVQA